LHKIEGKIESNPIPEFLEVLFHFRGHSKKQLRQLDHIFRKWFTSDLAIHLVQKVCEPFVGDFLVANLSVFIVELCLADPELINHNLFSCLSIN
jgi:hypothetical protein